jgi:hypothetical protein
VARGTEGSVSAKRIFRPAPPKRVHCGFQGCKVRPSRGFMSLFCAEHARQLERIRERFEADKFKRHRRIDDEQGGSE